MSAIEHYMSLLEYEKKKKKTFKNTWITSEKWANQIELILVAWQPVSQWALCLVYVSGVSLLHCGVKRRAIRVQR